MSGYDDIAEEQAAAANEERQERRDRSQKDWIKRRVTPFEALKGAASIIAAVSVIGMGLGATLNWLPFAKAEDFAVLQRQVARHEAVLSNLQINQLQTLQLQLMDRLDKLDDQIQHSRDPGGTLELRANRNEAKQRLDSIADQIAQAKQPPH